MLDITSGLHANFTEGEVFDMLGKAKNPSEILSRLRDSYPSMYWSVYEKVLRIGARTHPGMFTEYVFRGGDGSIRIQPKFHQEWDAIWDLRPPRCFIKVPRNHAKTSKAISRVLWEIAKNPNIRIKIVCAGDGLAVNITGSIAEHIEKNEYLHEVFPNLRPDKSNSWSKHELYVERPMVGIKDATVGAFGVMSTGTGGRADIILFDDIANMRNTIQQPAMRQMVIYAFREDWMNLLEPEGLAWVLGTSWHKGDVYSVVIEPMCLAKESGWFMYKKPAIIEKVRKVKVMTDDGVEREVLERYKEPLWRERFSLEYFEAKRKEGEKSFLRQYMLMNVTDDEGDGFTEPVWLPDKAGEVVPPEWPRFMGIDLASALTKRGKFSVFFTGALKPDGHRVIVDIVRGKFSFSQICDFIVSLYLTHNHKRIIVETNAFQKAVFTFVSEKYPWIPIEGFVTGNQKADIKLGIPGLALEYERGFWEVWRAKPSLTETSPIASFIDELMSYPESRTTDTVMANWFCREAITRYESGSHISIRTL